MGRCRVVVGGGIYCRGSQGGSARAVAARRLTPPESKPRQTATATASETACQAARAEYGGGRVYSTTTKAFAMRSSNAGSLESVHRALRAYAPDPHTVRMVSAFLQRGPQLPLPADALGDLADGHVDLGAGQPVKKWHPSDFGDSTRKPVRIGYQRRPATTPTTTRKPSIPSPWRGSGCSIAARCAPFSRALSTHVRRRSAD